MPKGIKDKSLPEFEPRVVGEYKAGNGQTYKIKLCHFEDCDNPFYSRGLCGGHYERLRLGKELPGPSLIKDSYRPPCEFKGCAHLAWTAAGGFCRTHNGHLWKFGAVREIKFYKMIGFTEGGRICKDCNEDKPLSEFYKKKHHKSPDNFHYSTQCKKCYMIDVSYTQGRALWKADGSDPLGWKDDPEAMREKQEATYARQRITSRLYMQKKRAENA